MCAVRYDRIDAPEWMTSPFAKTAEGFLVGRACVTNIGVFPYAKADGSIDYELRHPDDVFEADSLNSLRMKAVTNNHPSVLVTPENIKDYQVGNLGNNPAGYDNIHLTIDMTIQSRAAIDDIISGKQELSCGYTADVVDESGTWLGMPYTSRQKNIRYNHVALVDKARAGESARVRLDAGDTIRVDNATVVANNIDTNKEDVMAENLKTVKFDGIEYSAEETVLVKLNEAQTRADSLQTKLDTSVAEKSTIEAERDSLKERFDASDKKVKELEAARIDEAMIEARVAKRLEILDVANKAEVEVKADMAEAEIVAAVIKKAFPASDLTGKDAAYISARFDCAKEVLAVASDASVRAAGAGELHSDSADGNLEDKARAKFLADRAEQYKLKDKE